MAVSPEPPVAPGVHPSPIQRVVALLEVLLCSDYPTQAALGATFTALGYGPYAANGDLRVGFVVTLSLVDTALLVGLMLFFLHAHGERPRDVFLGAPGCSRGLVRPAARLRRAGDRGGHPGDDPALRSLAAHRRAQPAAGVDSR